MGTYGGEEGGGYPGEELEQRCPSENHGIIPARAHPQGMQLSLKTGTHGLPEHPGLLFGPLPHTQQKETGFTYSVVSLVGAHLEQEH